MKCPFCGFEDTQVIDTRVVEDSNSVRRRRRCPHCDKRFNTFETAEIRMPLVIKSNQERVLFDEEKLRKSLMRAIHKRQISLEQIDTAVANIAQQLLHTGRREVSTRTIGELAMRQLVALDQVAYVRFASVYKQFDDVSEFTRAIATLPESGSPG